MPVKRFSKQNPCPICGGYDEADRGTGRRCYGYLSGDGRFANCTREEFAGALPLREQSGTYGHYLGPGECRCGQNHGAPAVSVKERTLTDTYQYHDADGTLLYETCRYAIEGGGKTFRQRRPAPEGWQRCGHDGCAPAEVDGWVWSLAGCNCQEECRCIHPVGRVLYRLPQLLAKLKRDPEVMVYVCAGEKDAETLRNFGLVATTNPEGEGKGKWRPQFTETLKGCHCAIMQDNDETGKAHAKEVADALTGVAATVRVIGLPGLKNHGDVTDWIEAGHSPDELAAIVSEAPEWGKTRESLQGKILALPEILAFTVPARPDWLVDGMMLPEEHSMVAGEPGSYKTWLSLQLALSIATGTPFLERYEVRPGPVLYWTEEETVSQACRKLQLLHNGLGLNGSGELHLAAHKGWLLDNDTARAELIETLIGLKATALFVDSYVRVHVGDENDASHNAVVTAAIKEVCNKTGVGLWIVHHHRKRSKETELNSAKQMARGSGEILAGVGLLHSMTTLGHRSVSLTQEKNRHADEMEGVVINVESVEEEYVRLEGAGPLRMEAENTVHYAELMRAHIEREGEMWRQDVVKFLAAEGATGSGASAAIRFGEQAGWLKRRIDGRRTYLRVVEPKEAPWEN